MRFMIIERFRGQDGQSVCRHFRDRRRLRPDIVPVVAGKETGAALAHLP